MNIAIAYIAVSQGVVTADFASRFVATYQLFPAGEPHSLTILCNGGPLPTEIGMLFASVKCDFYPRVNDPGWDCSAYRDFASHTDADMLVCLGESIYFTQEGWLKRLADAWRKHGPGMYSPFSSHCVRAHLNTNAFAVPPKCLREYPYPTRNRAERYGMEHGENALWRWMHARSYPTMLVTWDGEWLPGQWRYPKNILCRGDQSNLLMRCSHTDRFDLAPISTKISMAKASDRPFR